jgi:ADP-heptose:LPS heptosyltransferase
VSERPPSVVVLRALGLGDTLTGVAPLRGLRRAFPGARLVLAAPGALGSWLCRLGVVDDVWPTRGLSPLHPPEHGGPVDVAVNLHGRGPQSHAVLQGLRPARLVAFRCPDADHDAGPTWRAGEHEVERWCRLVRDVGGTCGPGDLRLAPPGGGPRRGPVVVHPGAASGARRWPAERWRQVAGWLSARGEPVVVTGSDGERALCAEVARDVSGVRDLGGALDLDGLADLVAGARLLLCGDTGVAHLATAFSTPSVLLFGPTPPTWWGPALDQHLHAVLWHGRSAVAPGDPHAERLDPALARIEVPEVLDAAGALLG